MSQSPNSPFPQSVTIPRNTNPGVTLRSLLNLPDRSYLEVEILALVPAGTARGAVIMSCPRPGAALANTDFTTHGRYVPAGEAHVIPGPNGLDAYVKSASNADVTAIIEVI